MRIYLDVDGVINPMRPVPGDGFGDWRYEEFFTWSPSMTERLGSLAAQRCWLTTWGDRANRYLCPVIGWTPQVEIKREPEFFWWKLEALVREHPVDEPFVWVDDDLDEYRANGAGLVESSIEHLAPRHLLVSPDPYLGITPDQMAEIERFIAAGR